VLNAANEVTVEYFLNGQIRFSDIATLNERVLGVHVPRPVTDLDGLLEADQWARAEARAAISLLKHEAAA
jgi:1-deoxy-D-xylulose-5-phosphate reductoisomerase